ncbi:MAG TPA: hypothetical protein VGR97_14070, partial [Candidatus Acidoferrales bacterium]|nr:hypothetical protein [Candidatus Acidoferrales bacterium]
TVGRWDWIIAAVVHSWHADWVSSLGGDTVGEGKHATFRYTYLTRREMARDFAFRLRRSVEVGYPLVEVERRRRDDP